VRQRHPWGTQFHAARISNDVRQSPVFGQSDSLVACTMIASCSDVAEQLSLGGAAALARNEGVASSLRSETRQV
jgi:hypothetical protein